ncbi:hypothetical protein CDAR_476121 [Caerostris darwini]|uniref:Uncharacterized protein n=1 Tax=Caerostris darwini TaxID=1538125 RepID=A0AAV4PCL3_9ARAC|nr:hypothetical protein CDAR_476121 [Caerostris darwini]
MNSRPPSSLLGVRLLFRLRLIASGHSRKSHLYGALHSFGLNHGEETMVQISTVVFCLLFRLRLMASGHSCKSTFMALSIRLGLCEEMVVHSVAHNENLR